jgi:hypothetical protein
MKTGRFQRAQLMPPGIPAFGEPMPPTSASFGPPAPRSVRRSGTESSQTLCWREMDSNHRYPAKFFHRALTMFAPDSTLEEAGFEPSVPRQGHAASAALVSIVPTEHLRSLASSEASSSRPTLADRSPPLGPAHHHVNLAAAASRAPKPVAPVEHGRPVAIPPGLLGWVGFDPILARFARADGRHSPTP